LRSFDEFDRRPRLFRFGLHESVIRALITALEMASKFRLGIAGTMILKSIIWPLGICAGRSAIEIMTQPSG